MDKDIYMQGCCRPFRRGHVHAVWAHRGYRLRRKQVAHVCVFSISPKNQTGIQSDHAWICVDGDTWFFEKNIKQDRCKTWMNNTNFFLVHATNNRREPCPVPQNVAAVNPRLPSHFLAFFQSGSLVWCSQDRATMIVARTPSQAPVLTRGIATS